MPIDRSLLALAMTIALAVAGVSKSLAQEATGEPGDVRLAAGWIGQVLDDVAKSAKAVGLEFAARFDDSPPATQDDAAEWRGRAETRGSTTGFRTWTSDAAEPSFQAPEAALYSYGDAAVTLEKVARLAALESLVPVVRAAYRSFDYAWVYITTADSIMLIYPYVPPEEAVNNDRPTEQIYYTAADFDGRSVGWTPPYLDLVGAGMMITASYPVFDGDEPIGVASRDITLDELSASILGRLAHSGGATALLVDGRGLAIGASAPELQAEIGRVNTDAGAAALFYRGAASLEGLDVEGARSSAHDWVNAAVDRVIEGAQHAGDDPQSFESDGRTVSATRIERTGWFVILIGDPA